MAKHLEEMERTGFSGGQILAGVLLGAAAGATAALLLAPNSGSETRRRIRSLASDSKDRAGRLPAALSQAKQAAVTAFQKALAEGGDAHDVAARPALSNSEATS